MNSEIALQNLNYIKRCGNLTENNYVVTHNRIFENTDDKFDQVYSLKEMEYMIYFTFTECLYLIENHRPLRKEIINDLYEVYDILEVYYGDVGERDEIYEEMMDRFDEKLEHHYSMYIMGSCHYYSEMLSNTIYNILYDCANEVFYNRTVIIKSTSDDTVNTDDDTVNTDDDTVNTDADTINTDADTINTDADTINTEKKDI